MDSVTELMHPVQESSRLQDLLPASWRMATTIVQRPDQATTITSTPILPWRHKTQIRLNFRLWAALEVNHRDLLFLREVAWRHSAQWLQWGTYQMVGGFGLAGTIWELAQGDITGIAVGILLTAIAATQINRRHQGMQLQLEADQEALRVAQRRGYAETIAARSLLEALQALATLEGRSEVEFIELIRCQNLRVLAGLSRIGIPPEAKEGDRE